MLVAVRTRLRTRILDMPSSIRMQNRSTLSKKDMIEVIREIQNRTIWLSTYMIHNANNLRPKRDGLKVGGHQASSTSLSTILSTLYFSGMRENDRIAVKPHASPIFHSINYLLGNQTEQNMRNFRAFGGVQSYPSRTKDAVDVDFSTGSVGLGAAITTFAAYAQDWLIAKGIPLKNAGKDRGRMIAVVGDAELDEGNVFECLIESWKLGIRDNWWIVDYNRQSLDKVADDASFRQIDKMFRANGWEVITIKYGKKLLRAFDGRGGKHIRKSFNACNNQTYSSMVFAGGKAFREYFTNEVGHEDGVREFLRQYTDDELYGIFTDLGGHCIETLIEAFETASSMPSSRVCFLCYTIKGYKLPIAGHKDNHGLFLNNSQIEGLRKTFGVPEGQEWAPLAGISPKNMVKVQQVLNESFYKSVDSKKKRDYAAQAEVLKIPDMFFEVDHTRQTSTQTVFGQVLLTAAKSNDLYASRIMTMAPDVATSTNLGGFINTRGVFGLMERPDTSKEPSVNKWKISPKGQHIELGIAENNLFLLLSAAGMSANLFGQRILPIGTLYDPFIARGLDALNYGCYQDSRFMIASTPSGIALAPEGGAHQSINTPLIGMGQPGLVYFEPTFADEVQVLMSWGFSHMQKPAGEGGSIYLRLSTRMIDQIPRKMTPELRDSIIRGGYFHGNAPDENTVLCIAFSGVVYPEVMQAAAVLRTSAEFEHPNAVCLLQVTSPDRLYNDCNRNVESKSSYIQKLFSGLKKDAKVLSVIDGYPSALTWLAAVKGNRMRSLGVTQFGQSGDIPDLFKHYGLDSDSIVAASKRLIVEQ